VTHALLTWKVALCIESIRKGLMASNDYKSHFVEFISTPWFAFLALDYFLCLIITLLVCKLAVQLQQVVVRTTSPNVTLFLIFPTIIIQGLRYMSIFDYDQLLEEKSIWDWNNNVVIACLFFGHLHKHIYGHFGQRNKLPLFLLLKFLWVILSHYKHWYPLSFYVQLLTGIFIWRPSDILEK